MKYLKFISAVIMAYTVCACGTKNGSTAETANVEQEVEKSESIETSHDFSDLIKTVYEQLVFATVTEPDMYAPEQFFTPKALKKLKDSYEFDCENGDCYAYYELRTQAQDSKPGSDEESGVISIESIGDNTYIVKYLDMGWKGMTRIKIADGKIDDFERCAES